MQASAARLEEQLADCESALVEEKTVSLERKHETKQYQYQVRQELQGNVEELRVYPQLLSEAEQSLLECQENLQSLERKCSEKSESVKQLQFKEEALSYGNRQLDQRSSECQALNRQLEAALSDVREQVANDEMTDCRADVRINCCLSVIDLQAEKQFEVRLKDLQLSLDQSESHKRSIQNYVDFLKNSYKTMFDEGLQTSAFGPSYFLK
ncbi:hypothetical protein GOODEAATRI_020273 [Goodea atripinnis]|uniref:Uncharacterized protein n=1 Tax=Goodea atripinnis TaxID=208336 RepID=A0ABV0NMU1_9TELE